MCENFKLPLDVMNQAKEKNVFSFHRLNAGSCYHCKWMTTDLKKWYCHKWKIVFGSEGNRVEYAIANQAEFVCDEFEEVGDDFVTQVIMLQA